VKIGLITKEWPPHIYGGAGVHALQLTQALRSKIDVDVHTFGKNGDATPGDATHHPIPESFATLNPALAALITDIEIAQAADGVDLLHSHTWYANMGGHLGGLLHGVPHVITAHSLEPDRPWKAEQLGGGYAISSWAEKNAYENADAIIAVSNGMRTDILKAYPNLDPEKVHVILNGVDTEAFIPTSDPAIVNRYGITGRYAIFIGRITRQKGLAHLLHAWHEVNPDVGLVLVAGNADEPGIGREIQELIEGLQKERTNIWWIQERLDVERMRVLLTGAELFLCPSIYEPLGIVNLEAMACETAVLASRVGGIPEVVQDGITGQLVDYNGDGPAFEAALAKAANELLAQPAKLNEFGIAGRKRAIADFSWEAIADQTIALYSEVIASRKK
jgi:alpha-maltose-1-phosphate synthase